MSYVIRVTCTQHLGDRENQEDALGTSSPDDFESKGMLAVLSDGMGGMERGEFYSSLAVNAMLNAFRNAPADAEPLKGLLRMYGEVRTQALSLTQGSERPEDGGATLVAALIRDDELSFLSVGDSCIDLFRGGGLIRLNRPQTLGVRLDERAAMGYIPQETAQMNTMRDALTNHINATRPQPCDLCSRPIRLLPGDRILITSDGVTNSLSQQTITDVLSSTHEAARALITELKRASLPRQDNASVLLLDVLPEDLKGGF